MTKHGHYKATYVGTCTLAIPDSLPVDEDALRDYFDFADWNHSAVEWSGWVDDVQFEAFGFRELTRAEVAIKRGRKAEAILKEMNELQERLSNLPFVNFKVPEDYLTCS